MPPAPKRLSLRADISPALYARKVKAPTGLTRHGSERIVLNILLDSYLTASEDIYDLHGLRALVDFQQAFHKGHITYIDLPQIAEALKHDFVGRLDLVALLNPRNNALTLNGRALEFIQGKLEGSNPMEDAYLLALKHVGDILKDGFLGVEGGA